MLIGGQEPSSQEPQSILHGLTDEQRIDLIEDAIEEFNTEDAEQLIANLSLTWEEDKQWVRDYIQNTKEMELGDGKQTISFQQYLKKTQRRTPNDTAQSSYPT